MAIPTGTKIPSVGGFLKAKEGDTNFRLLTDFIVGFQGWKDKKSFLRYPNADGSCSISPDEVDVKTLYSVGDPQIDYVWVAKALDLEEGGVKLLTISQKTLMKAIEAWEENPRGGDIRKFDCNILGKKEGGKTSYTFQAFPQGKIEESWEKQIATADLSFDGIFEGEDVAKSNAEFDGLGDIPAK